MEDAEIVTEPDGDGIRFVGFSNPSPFLQRTVINRGEAYMMLEGHTIDVKTKPGKDPVLQLSPELRFSYMTEADIDPKTKMPKVVKKKGGAVKIHHSHLDEFSLTAPSFFTNTSKMSAASWSIPAGPPSVGGACASAELFKSTSQYNVALKQGVVAQRPASKPDWICQFCYAGKSNYMHRTSQYSQTARWIWLRGMVQHHGLEGAASAMAAALRAHQGNTKLREKLGENPAFFRIHDSGDFTLSPNTYLLWTLVARELPGIQFWAPTRMWTFPKFNEMVRANQPPPNMSIRPSALHFADVAPDLDGFDSGSTAHDIELDPVKAKLADWICPAYQHDGHTCAGAGGPKGEKDCRVCWIHTDMAVSYRSH
jgi:Gene product 88